MSPIEAGARTPIIRTAMSLEEAARYTDAFVDYHDEGDNVPERFSDDEISEYKALARLVYRVVSSQFNTKALGADDIEEIEAILARVALYAVRGGIGEPSLRLMTDLARNRFGSQVSKEFIASGVCLDEEFGTREIRVLPIKTYRKVVDEALLAYGCTLDHEVRMCVHCSKWFTSQLKGRARFCSASCRKSFAVEGDEPSRCRLGNHEMPKSACSGLRRRNEYLDDWKYSDRLVFGSVSLVDEFEWRLCAPCVAKQFPEWASYVAPALQSIERAKQGVSA